MKLQFTETLPGNQSSQEGECNTEDDHNVVSTYLDVSKSRSDTGRDSDDEMTDLELILPMLFLHA